MTVFPVPTAFVSKVPVAVTVMESPATAVYDGVTVAVVVPLYVRFVAVIVTVRVLAVIAAVPDVVVLAL